MIDRAAYKLAPPRTIASAGLALPAPVRVWPPALERMRLRFGRRAVWIGRASLALFAALALVSANREAGLLALGPVEQLRSAVRGAVPVGVAFLLLPAGAVLWLAGTLALRPAGDRVPRGRLGPPVVAVPLSILVALTLVHLNSTIGWAEVGFVLVGLALLVLTYLFVLYGRVSGAAVAAFVALAGGVQALVGLGQFVLQHDLGLRWLGELPLNPSVSGISVLVNSTRILRAYGLMRHPNALGAILPLSLLAALSLWMRARRPARPVWLLLMVIITAGLVASFSRAGWLAALAGTGVWLLAGRPAPGRRHPLGRATWAPAILALALVVVVAVCLQPELFVGRLLGLVGLGVGVEHWSLTERLAAIQWAWQVIQRGPLWGVGTQRYVVVVAQLMRVQPAESLVVDSTLLVLWAEQGVAGPLAWLGLGAALVWLGCRRGAGSVDLALATGWVAAIQVVCLFQAYFWPGLELWQGGIWLGLALGLWARASTHSFRPSASARPGALPGGSGYRPGLPDNYWRLGAIVPEAHGPGPG